MLCPMRFVDLACRDKKTRDSRKLTPNGVEEDLFDPLHSEFTYIMYLCFLASLS